MKIWGNIPKVSGIYEKQKNVNKMDKASGISGKKDVLSISNQAKDFQTVMKALRDVPDIRKGKVDELAQKYQSGNYSVDGRDVADKIVKSLFDKKA